MFILSEDSERTHGKDARSSNISAGKAVAETVRTTLGPRGMDKMLVSDSGDVVITNDGATILNEMDIDHPAAQMLVEVAESQEEEVGDGTTTAGVLAGQLLDEAEEFLERDIHPTTIAEGYARARDIALDALEAEVIDGDLDDETLEAVAESSMTGKGTGGLTAEALAEDIVTAVRSAQENGSVSRADVNIVAQSGESSSATELVDGVIIDEEPLREGMPRSVDAATIAVVDTDLETREASVDVEYNVQSADQLDQAVESEQRELKAYADALVNAGVDVAFVTGDVADLTAGYLANAGILAFDSVDDDTVQAIANATGASRVATVADIAAEDLGSAESVHVDRYGEDEVTFVEGGDVGKSVSIFVRGGTGHVMDELERAIEDGVDSVITAIERGGVVPGAAATEVRVAQAIREAAAGIEGRQQLAVEAFADALDAIPRTLAENAGMDPIDGLVEVRAANESGRAGIVLEDGAVTIDDPVDHDILDPVAVKREVIGSATEAATMIVRIDDVISAE
ncbi:thermosome subunit alpha [Halanaeroarchaeum sp. HSR-CO]|uniref:thermosome subunit alpha n=1 Tax=Halanaeroarchaeum sp. HSR-CO TaxID=2866382 RepID=UPI00217E7FC9|nr:thermosome subunit alpha [Halanaeroarchaeum sp. HSR-CO]